MANFLRVILGAARSNTMRGNALFGAIWAAAFQSDLIQSNPEYVAIGVALQTIFNMIMRARTDRALSKR